MVKRSIFAASIGAAVMLVSSAALAGEITGPPPIDNSKGGAGRISNGLSFCSYSGLNDTPLGIPGRDPGGQVQSFGFFMAQFGLYDPSDPSDRDSFNFPGVGCNPNKGAPAR